MFFFCQNEKKELEDRHKEDRENMENLQDQCKQTQLQLSDALVKQDESNKKYGIDFKEGRGGVFLVFVVRDHDANA